LIAVKLARNIVLGILGFGAWIVIGIAGDSFRERGENLVTADIIYLLLLVLAVIYFHWLFRVFLMPLAGLPESERAALVDKTMSKYWGGFFRGTVGFGYFLLCLYGFAFVVETPRRSDVPNFALGAIFFIGLGVLAQTRALVLTLTRRELDIRQKESIEQGGPANQSQPVGPATNQTSSAAGSGRSLLRWARSHMHKSIVIDCLVGIAIFVTGACQAQAQGIFRADMAEQQPGGVSFFGGVGYFRITPDIGQFEIAIVAFTERFTPIIYTPAGSLTFSLGAGEPRIYSGCDPFQYHPFLPPPSYSPAGYECPAFMTGAHYAGSFQPSPDVFADLLAGRGEFRLLSDSGTLLTGAIAVVPEPSTLGLFLCGAFVFAFRVRRAVC
jgi:hypothetical protein